ncbi:MAG: hypothetical protein IJS26_04705 [Alphaproteobacteria bacterium]|nr:hypothetical protein [Alphaproteobacteria bacterium]
MDFHKKYIKYFNAPCVDGLVSIKISMFCKEIEKYSNDDIVGLLSAQIHDAVLSNIPYESELCTAFNVDKNKNVDIYCIVQDDIRTEQEILNIIKAALLENDFDCGDFIETSVELHSNLDKWIKTRSKLRESFVSFISTPRIGMALNRFLSRYRH